MVHLIWYACLSVREWLRDNKKPGLDTWIHTHRFEYIAPLLSYPSQAADQSLPLASIGPKACNHPARNARESPGELS